MTVSEEESKVIDFNDYPKKEAIALIQQLLGMDEATAITYYGISTGEFEGDVVDQDGNAHLDEIGPLKA